MFENFNEFLVAGQLPLEVVAMALAGLDAVRQAEIFGFLPAAGARRDVIARPFLAAVGDRLGVMLERIGGITGPHHELNWATHIAMPILKLGLVALVDQQFGLKAF